MFAGPATYRPHRLARTSAAQQRPPLRGRPAAHRGDHHGHALLRHGLHGLRRSRADGYPLAGGAADQEALDLTELDLDSRRGSVLVQSGNGGDRRELGMDHWGFEQLEPRVTARQAMPVGPLSCVISGRTCGRPWPPSAATTIELAHEGVPLNVIKRRLGHRNPDRPSRHQPDEISATIDTRRPPMIPVGAGLALLASR
jgi:hypothetical protein